MPQAQQVQQPKNGVRPGDKTDPEVVPMARRRQFSQAYKLRILAVVNSVAEKVMRSAKCATLVIREQESIHKESLVRVQEV